MTEARRRRSIVNGPLAKPGLPSVASDPAICDGLPTMTDLAFQPPSIDRGRPLLALDCGGAHLSVAIAEAGRLIAAKGEPLARGQGERLLPTVEAAMADAGLSFAALGGILVAVGPGSFTGLRIAIAAARGLALAAGCPCLGLSSFEVALEAQPASAAQGRTTWVLLESKRAEAFAQAFDAERHRDGAPFLATAAEIAERLAAPTPPILCGDLDPAPFGLAPSDHPGLGRSIEARAILSLAERYLTLGVRFLPPDPIYLRAPDVTLPPVGKPR
jgi:tRNA threonylcarbamoyladenosine biosynthesis protein TsaB